MIVVLHLLPYVATCSSVLKSPRPKSNLLSQLLKKMQREVCYFLVKPGYMLGKGIGKVMLHVTLGHNIENVLTNTGQEDDSRSTMFSGKL